MDALNFLYQKPALTWFDFYLEPNELLVHLSQKYPDPDDGQLITQFCEQANFEEQQCLVPDIFPEDIEYHQKKARKLWFLAFKICAHLNWNLPVLRKKCGIVCMKNLMQKLCEFILGTDEFSSVLSKRNERITSEGTTTPPCNLVVSIQTLRARWILDTIRNDAFPTPPPRITVSNPSAQVDPSLPMLEAKAAAVKELKEISETAVKFLEAIATDKSLVEKTYVLPKSTCFVIPKGNDQEANEETTIGEMEFNWNQVDPVSPNWIFLQCCYDMLEHYFFLRQFERAKECALTVWKEWHGIEGPIHGHLNLDKTRLTGYCRALKIDIGAANEENVDSRQHSLVWQHAEEEEHATQKSLAKYAQLRSKSILDSMRQLDGVTERDIVFLRTIENATTFCLALKNELSSRPTTARNTIVVAYLEFICSCHPALLDTLKGCGVVERLNTRQESFRRTTWPKPKESRPDSTLLSKLEPPWHVLHTFDPVELKANAQRTQPNRVSAHFFVPASVQPLLLKLPHSIYQDVVALACCKAQQLTQIGATTAVPALLELASNEARSGSGETAPEFKWELIRLELIRWHNLLHHCSDVQRMGQMTMDLANKVKSFIASCGHKGSPALNAYWEIPMLATSFLLNTCDWDYILLCASFHRFANFGKVLGALCHEIQKAGTNVRTYARDFFDIMLPTMMDTIQYKRGAGGSHLSVVREAPSQLLTRSYFTAIVKHLKEPSAISLLIAFFVKLYNGLKGGMVEIYSEHLTLWPTSFVDSTGVNEAYLKELLQITLDNALLVNPNNAFWLRAKGDYELINDKFESALQYYLQCMFACSDGFTKRLPENVVDDKLILNMVKCCGRMECHTLEALLCQLLQDANYGLAIKALRETVSYDGMDAYFGMIWDPALMELLIYILEKSNQQQARLETAMRIYAQQENNIHNDESILNIVTTRRRKAFLTAMCRLFF